MATTKEGATSPAFSLEMNPAVGKLESVDMQEATRIAAMVDSWEADTFEIGSFSGNRPLLFVAYEIFRYYQLFETFKLDLKVFETFISRIEAAYDERNPYHNSIHAADVAISLNHLLKKGKTEGFFSDLDLLSVFVGAFVHDVDHPGHSNSFEIVTASDRAQLYNDQAVLENHHLARAFEIIGDGGGVGLLFCLQPVECTRFRANLIDFVLGTDLGRHAEMVNQFKDITQKQPPGPNSGVWKQFPRTILRSFLKTADISHAAKTWHIHEKWTAAITEEFFRQGDKEKALGLSVSRFMNREKNEIGQSQHGFMVFIVKPIFELVAQYVDTDIATSIMNHLKANCDAWEKTAETERKGGNVGAPSAVAPLPERYSYRLGM